MKIAECILAATGDYTQTLAINSIDALPTHVELSISSVLRTAKNPEEPQSIHSVIVHKDMLRDIIATIEHARQ